MIEIVKLRQFLTKLKSAAWKPSYAATLYEAVMPVAHAAEIFMAMTAKSRLSLPTFYSS